MDTSFKSFLEFQNDILPKYKGAGVLNFPKFAT
jgi:hypothetical protein